MTVLTLILHRKFFCAILNGKKPIEYRDNTTYWEKRLKNKTYTHVRFRNGYLNNAPELLVKLKKVVDVGDQYELHLGDIIQTKNTEGLEMVACLQPANRATRLRATGG